MKKNMIFFTLEKNSVIHFYAFCFTVAYFKDMTTQMNRNKYHRCENQASYENYLMRSLAQPILMCIIVKYYD